MINKNSKSILSTDEQHRNDNMIWIYLIVTLLALYFLFKWNQSSKKLRKLPGPKGLPFIGSALDVNEDNMLDKLYGYAEDYGEIVGIKLLNQNMVCLNSERVIRKALAGEPYKQYMNNRGKFFFSDTMMFGGQDVVFYDDPFSTVYSGMRKGITKGLHVYGQDGFNEFEARIFTELDRLNKQIESFHGRDFEVVELLKRSLTNVVALTLGGESLSSDDKDLNMFWDFIHGANYFLKPTVNNLLSAFPILRHAPKFRSSYKRMCQAREQLYERYCKDRKNREENKPKGLVDHMIELQMKSEKKGQEVIFTDERILCNVLDSVMAGILTTLSVLSSTILCLVTHPEYQEKVFQEIVENIGQERLPTHADKNNCPYLEALELEVHRYMTVAPILGGRICTRDIDFEGYHLAKGSWLLVNTWYLHHDPKVWGDPWTFRPERFLDAEGRLLPRDHTLRKNWIAFSNGRRQCLGEQFARSRYFLYMMTLLRRWKFVGSPGKYGPCNPKTMENIDSNVTVRPQPFFCFAEKRQ